MDMSIGALKPRWTVRGSVALVVLAAAAGVTGAGAAPAGASQSSRLLRRPR